MTSPPESGIRMELGPVRARPAVALPCELRQHLGGEALELLKLIVAHEAEAEVGDTGVGVPAERGDHRVRWAEAHRAAHVHAAPVVVREKLTGSALGRAYVVLEADRRVDTERKAGEAAPAPGQRLVGALADQAAVLGLDVGRDDTVAQPGEPVEL